MLVGKGLEGQRKLCFRLTNELLNPAAQLRRQQSSRIHDVSDARDRIKQLTFLSDGFLERNFL